MATKLLLGGCCLRLKPASPRPASIARYQLLIHHRTRDLMRFYPQNPSSRTVLRGRGAERRSPTTMVVSARMQPLDLTEENVEKVLMEARVELAQLFDTSVGITGQAELAELDGPFVKIRLRGKFWHKRSTVLARLDNFLRQRIPEILEVDIEDDKQLDDSPANF